VASYVREPSLVFIRLSSYTVPGWAGNADSLGWICTQMRIRMILEALIFGIYPLLSLVALFALGQSRLTGIPQVLWAS